MTAKAFETPAALEYLATQACTDLTTSVGALVLEELEAAGYIVEDAGLADEPGVAQVKLRFAAADGASPEAREKRAIALGRGQVFAPQVREALLRRQAAAARVAEVVGESRPLAEAASDELGTALVDAAVRVFMYTGNDLPLEAALRVYRRLREDATEVSVT